jgi:hypothetical protein
LGFSAAAPFPFAAGVGFAGALVWGAACVAQEAVAASSNNTVSKTQTLLFFIDSPPPVVGVRA